MKRKAAHGWCVISPEGFSEYDADHTKRTRQAAIEQCEETMERPWKYLYRRGYRVVKVTVTED